MAFNINAHVILSGPKNIKAVTKNIQKQLGSVNVRVNLQVPKNLNKQIGSFNKGLQSLTKNVTNLRGASASANTQLTNLTKHFQNLNNAASSLAKSQSSVQKSLGQTGKQVHEVRNEIQAFGKDAALAIRRFAAFTVATGVVFGFVRAVQSATKAALDYERSVVKIVQVTGASADKIKGLTNTINQLSVSLGIDANELAELSRMFAQTGQSIDQVRSSIRAVARSSLAPTFGSMKDTAEGLIAAMAQFNIAANRQEEVLAGLNAVAKKFAVESEDMISVIRRAGGVFSVAAGQMKDPVASLNELIGIFTAVRSTTRESADTIAVGLRTIFTRIQRRGTIDFLKQFNIELVNAKGQFIGLFPAFQQLSKGLDGIIKRGDALALSAITEELGGVRQVGKLIPAITQFNKALAATKIAGEAAKAGLGKDVALALQPLGKQFELLQQRFNALIRDVTQSTTFQNMAKVALSMANAFLSVAESLKPLIPLMTTFAAIKISRGLVDFGAGFIGGFKKGGGVGGAGGALGGAVTGGGGGGGAGGSIDHGALIAALQNNTTTMRNISGNVLTSTSQLKTSIDASRMSHTSETSGLVGAIGNLINTINRSSALGGIGRGKRFARGGYVSGPSHAQGGVPAVLEGGEYVIPKGYARGAEIRRGVAASRKDPKFRGTTQEKGLGKISLLGEQVAGIPDSDAIDTYGGAFLSPEGGTQDLKGRLDKGTIKKSLQQTKAYTLLAGARQGSPLRKELTEIETAATQKGDFTLLAEALSKSVSESIEDTILSNVESAVQGGAKLLGTSTRIDDGMAAEAVRILRQSNIDNVIGNIYEAILSNAGTPYHKSDRDAANAPFDFPKGLGKVAKNFSAGRLRNIETDAKTRFTSGNISSFLKKAKNAEAGRLEDEIKKILDRPDMLAEFSARGKGSEISPRKKVEAFKAKAIKKAAGGSVFAPQGTDTVPAMLTPGEFVVNRKSAESFGYGNLKKINKYAKGGKVQYLQDGGRTTGGGSGGDAMGMVFGIQMAVGALAGFTAALAGFDLNAPMTSIMALGMVAMQAAGSFGLLAPGLSKTLMASKGMEGVMKKLKKPFQDLAKPFKSAGAEAKNMFHSARAARPAIKGGPGGLFGMVKPQAAVPSKSITQSLLAGSKGFFKSMKGNWLKIVKGSFSGFPGLIASLVIGPLVGAIGNAVADSAFGKKETIAGTNIEGRKRGGGGAAGMLEAAGTAAGTGLAAAAITAMIPGLAPLAPVVGLVVGAFQLFKGAVTGAAKQMEFLAFKEMAKAAQDATDSLKRFNEAEVVTLAMLKGVNNSLDKTMTAFDKVSNRSFDRERTDQAFTVSGALGSGGAVQSAVGVEGGVEGAAFSGLAGGAGGALAGAAAGLAVAGASAAVSAGSFAALGASVGSIAPVVGTAIGAIAGLVVGVGVGVVTSMMAANQRTEALVKSFDKAAMSITPEFMEQLDAGFQKASRSIVDNLAVLDEGVLREMANVHGVDPESTAGEQSVQAVSSFQKMGQALDKSTGAARKFVDQMNRMAATKMEVGLIKNIQDEASLLGDAGSEDLKEAFQLVRGSLRKGIKHATKTGNFDGITDAIMGMKGVSYQTKIALLDATKAQAQQITEQNKANATIKLAEIAAANANRGFDALAAGLERFGDRMSGVANQVNNLTAGLEADFAQITGEKTIGELRQVNPFTQENLATASDASIDNAISNLESLAPDQATGKSAFRDMAGLMKGQRDMPLVMRDAVAQLQDEAAKEGGVTNERVEEVLKKSLSAKGIELGPAATKVLQDQLASLGTTTRQKDGPDQLLFGVDKLEKIFSETGEVTQLFGKISETARKELERAFSAFGEFRQGLLKVGRLQEKMAKHRMDSELGILNKQESIRDRVNKALGKGAPSQGQAQKDLENRMAIQLTGGVAEDKRLDSARIQQGDMLNPEALFQRLQTLESKRDKIAEGMGLQTGQDIVPLSGDDAKRMTEAQQKSITEMANLNREMTGTELALKELANDTRMLAAIERQISKQQSKAKEATTSAVTIMDALDKLERGEMSGKEFSQQITGPITTVNKAMAKGVSIDRRESIDLLKRIQGGDPLVAGVLNNKFDELARQEGIDPKDEGAMQGLRTDFFDNLLQNAGGQFAALAESMGMPNLSGELSKLLSQKTAADAEAEKLGAVMQSVGNMQIDVLERTMDHQQKQMAKVLAMAHIGFQRAADKFQEAVVEFHKFRGEADAKATADMEAKPKQKPAPKEVPPEEPQFVPVPRAAQLEEGEKTEVEQQNMSSVPRLATPPTSLGSPLTVEEQAYVDSSVATATMPREPRDAPDDKKKKLGDPTKTTAEAEAKKKRLDAQREGSRAHGRRALGLKGGRSATTSKRYQKRTRKLTTAEYLKRQEASKVGAPTAERAEELRLNRVEFRKTSARKQEKDRTEKNATLREAAETRNKADAEQKKAMKGKSLEERAAYLKNKQKQKDESKKEKAKDDGWLRDATDTQAKRTEESRELDPSGKTQQKWASDARERANEGKGPGRWVPQTNEFGQVSGQKWEAETAPAATAQRVQAADQAAQVTEEGPQGPGRWVPQTNEFGQVSGQKWEAETAPAATAQQRQAELSRMNDGDVAVEAWRDKRNLGQANQTPRQRPQPASQPTAAGGNAMEELQKIMKGEALANSITGAFDRGGTSFVNKIEAAFAAIPEKMIVTGKFDPITVNLTGGGLIEKWSKGLTADIRQIVSDEIDNYLNKSTGSTEKQNTNSVAAANKSTTPSRSPTRS